MHPNRVFLCSGHMIDAPGRPEPRFPPYKEEAVRFQMAAHLERWKIQKGDLALCGGARGADLLFAELAHARGAEVILLLPFEPEEFIARSVILPGSDWEQRFRRLSGHCEVRIQTKELGPLPEGENPYVRNNGWLLHTALAAAGREEGVFALLVWDEKPTGDGPGGTSDLAARFLTGESRDRCAVVNPAKIDPSPAVP